MTSGRAVNKAGPTVTQGLNLAEFNAELSGRLVGPDSLIRPEKQQQQLSGRCQPRNPNERLAQAFALLSAAHKALNRPGSSIYFFIFFYSSRTVKPEAQSTTDTLMKDMAAALIITVPGNLGTPSNSHF